MVLLIGVVITLCGLALTVFGVRVLAESWRFWRGASRSRGVVSELLDHLGDEGERMTRPRVSFRASDGKRHSFDSSVARGRSRFKVGDEVEVLYDPEDPSHAEIARATYVLLAPMMAVSFGILALVWGSSLLAVELGWWSIP